MAEHPGSVPVPEKLGVTILYKIQSGTGGDDSEIRSNAIVRFMAVAGSV